MKYLVVLACAVAAASTLSFYDLVKEEWEAYKMQHNKDYADPMEDKFRMKIYAENAHKIAKHNQRFAKKQEPYSLQQNKYGDMLHHEFVRTMNGFNRTAKNEIQGRRGFCFIKKAWEAKKRIIKGVIDWTLNLCNSCEQTTTTTPCPTTETTTKKTKKPKTKTPEPSSEEPDSPEPTTKKPKTKKPKTKKPKPSSEEPDTPEDPDSPEPTTKKPKTKKPKTKKPKPSSEEPDTPEEPDSPEPTTKKPKTKKPKPSSEEPDTPEEPDSPEPTTKKPKTPKPKKPTPEPPEPVPDPPEPCENCGEPCVDCGEPCPTCGQVCPNCDGQGYDSGYSGGDGNDMHTLAFKIKAGKKRHRGHGMSARVASSPEHVAPAPHFTRTEN